MMLILLKILLKKNINRNDVLFKIFSSLREKALMLQLEIDQKINNIFILTLL